jgi:transglutaminase-like putative cysteine protease
MGVTGAWPGRSPPDRVKRYVIPWGDAGVIRTLRVMVDVVRWFKTDLHVRTLAVCLVGGRPVHLSDGRRIRYPPRAPKDFVGELQTLHAFVRDHIRYVRDVEGIETLQTPAQSLYVLAGDCDDKAMLLCALAGSIGFETRFCAIGVRGDPFSHVMAQALIPGDPDYINLETILTDPPVPIGWFPPDATTAMLAHNQSECG